MAEPSVPEVVVGIEEPRPIGYSDGLVVVRLCVGGVNGFLLIRIVERSVSKPG